MADTYYAWDPEFDCITKETDAAGVVTARYTQEPKPFGGLISQHRSGVSNYFHYDAIGTTRALTNSSQAVTDTAVYTAFGEKMASTGATVNPFGYGAAFGYYKNAIVSSLSVRARDFSEGLGRWFSEDPLSDFWPADFYKYSDNMPTVKIDPSGMRCYVCKWHHFINGETVASIDAMFSTGTPAAASVASWYAAYTGVTIATYRLTPVAPITAMVGQLRTSSVPLPLPDATLLPVGMFQYYSHGSAIVAEICSTDGTANGCKMSIREDVKKAVWDIKNRNWKVSATTVGAPMPLDCLSSGNVHCEVLNKTSRSSPECRIGILIYDEPSSAWVPETSLATIQSAMSGMEISVREVFQEIRIDSAAYRWRFKIGFDHPTTAKPVWKVPVQKTYVDKVRDCC